MCLSMIDRFYDECSMPVMITYNALTTVDQCLVYVSYARLVIVTLSGLLDTSYLFALCFRLSSVSYSK